MPNFQKTLKRIRIQWHLTKPNTDNSNLNIFQIPVIVNLNFVLCLIKSFNYNVGNTYFEVVFKPQNSA